MERSQLMKDLAIKAGKLQRERFGTPLDRSLKKDHSVVTEIDLASEKIIIAGIKEHFPNDLIYSEESNNEHFPTHCENNQRIWVIDPLDGTSNYAASIPFFCVSIGLLAPDERGRPHPEQGVIYAPIFDALYCGKKGGGATKNGKAFKMSASAPAFERACLVTGFYYDVGEVLEKDLARFVAVARKCQTIRRLGAAALDLCMVAEGCFDGFWERGLAPWDVAAAVVIVNEAGGKVRAYDRDQFDFSDEGLIAGKPEIVDTIAKFL